MASKADKPDVQSILDALQKLSPVEKQAILQTLQSGPASILKSPADGTVTLYSRPIRKLLEQCP